MNNKYKKLKKEDKEAFHTCLISAIISSIVAILILKYYFWNKSELSLLMALLSALLPLLFIFLGFIVFKRDIGKECEIYILKKWVSLCLKTTGILSILAIFTLKYYFSNKSQNVLLISLFFLFWAMAFCMITFFFRGMYDGMHDNN